VPRTDRPHIGQFVASPERDSGARPRDDPASYLPGWIKAPKQITDSHLSKLASANGAVLATLDENIPESYLIPK
jgi:hypothetical protein